MTLTLTIENETSLPNGAPVSVKVTDKRNLDIGRGAHLDWTLPDPSRFISGKHCEVRYRDGAYWLYDVSTNGTFLNDNTRRIQTPHKLDNGDRLAIGSYIILVTIEDEEPHKTSGAPFAATDAANAQAGAIKGSLAEEQAPASGEHAVAPVEEAKSTEAALTEGAPSAQPKTGADFWADLIAEDLGPQDEVTSETPAPAAPQPRMPIMPKIGALRLGGEQSNSEGHHNDKTAFAKTEAEPSTDNDRVAAHAGPAEPAFDAWLEKDAPEEKPASEDNTLFEKPSADASEPDEVELPPLPKADAFSLNRIDLHPSHLQPEPEPTPSVSLEIARLVVKASGAAHEAEAGEPAAAGHPPAASSPTLEKSAAPSELPRVADAPSAFVSNPRTKTQPPTSPPWMAPPLHAPAAEVTPPAQPPRPQATLTAPTEGDVTLDAFIERFATAAGIPAQLFDKRDKLKAADDLGFMIHLVVSSLRQLLSARDSAKRFARTSSRTVVQAFDNNPLKFAPTPEDALKIMFGPKTSGYLDARRTLESAFEDLKTHQIKTFSAMQGAVKMLVEDLDPEELDSSLGEEHGLAALLSSRKSKLWDLYLARWQAKTLRHEDGLADAFMFYFAECYDRAED